MTKRLQTRVKDGGAQNLKRTVGSRGKIPSVRLQQVVKRAAAEPEPRTWKNHRQLVESLKLTPVPYNVVAEMREESDEQ